MPLNFAILQTDLVWENPHRNIAHFSELIKRLDDNISLVLLPETFSTGFTMNVGNIEDQEEIALSWMIETAAKYRITLGGSLIIKEASCYYNRFYWVKPDNTFEYYDKRHLFRMGREQDHFCPGNKRVVVEDQGIRFLLQVCYDIRFPVFSRNRNDYDVIVYVANFPSARKHAWTTLLQARAIENQSYVLAVNRTGVDGEGVDNCGISCAIDMKGEYKARLDYKPGVLISSIDIEDIKQFRNKFPAHLDSDRFRLL